MALFRYYLLEYDFFMSFEFCLNEFPGWNDRLMGSFEPECSELQAAVLKELQEDIVSGALEVCDWTSCYCGADDFVEVCSNDRWGLDFKMVLCKHCGLLLTSPYIAESSLPHYYDKFYHSINYGRVELRPTDVLFSKGQGAKVFNRVSKFLGSSPRVLEIGAGTGSVLCEFKEEATKHNKDVEIFGAEYSSLCVELMAQKGIPAVQGGAAEVFEQFDTNFDVIILSHVLEHVVDVRGFLKSIAKLMTDETLLYVEVPSVETIHTSMFYHSDLRRYFTHSHIAHYNIHSLKSVVESNGFGCLDEGVCAYGVFCIKEPKARNAQADKINAMRIFLYLQNLERTYDLTKDQRECSSNLRVLRTQHGHLKEQYALLQDRYEKLRFKVDLLKKNPLFFLLKKLIRSV